MSCYERATAEMTPVTLFHEAVEQVDRRWRHPSLYPPNGELRCFLLMRVAGR